jgi:hypothetical protein
MQSSDGESLNLTRDIAIMGYLTFRCPKTGEEFDSGFQANPDELRSMPPGHKSAVRCKNCFETH